MKKILLATVALVAFGAAPALAADLAARPYNKAPVYAPPVPIYNWTGFYIGGHIGGAFAGDNSIGTGVTANSDGKFLGGVQAGYDWQFAPSWVLGVEGQYSWLSGTNDAVAFTVVGQPGIYSFSDNQRGLASVTGRLGYTWGPALLYVKGGWAYADYKSSLSNTVLGSISSTSSQDGYTVGGGLEYLFAQNWSGKIEYQYYDFGNVDLGAGFTAKNDQHVVKAGLNYRFNWGGPVVAKY
ncbi:outer membrane protein [Rhodopseudomonas pseudopalustris]|uniref:Outer membrane immunogenic protein n=1 Tax=Rhodopseudomonas pseudopalustris TaxID=1513892 RepID=A0A1H8TX32_9BRAD|nr:outer membrane beta-barrel protein [Rhodopseudomonas pseudopalustris]SEO95471.1 outer membrane immunogenic protein [Rhodopseudomonas pseudopalustris]